MRCRRGRFGIPPRLAPCLLYACPPTPCGGLNRTIPAGDPDVALRLFVRPGDDGRNGDPADRRGAAERSRRQRRRSGRDECGAAPGPTRVYDLLPDLAPVPWPGVFALRRGGGDHSGTTAPGRTHRAQARCSRRSSAGFRSLRLAQEHAWNDGHHPEPRAQRRVRGRPRADDRQPPVRV